MLEARDTVVFIEDLISIDVRWAFRFQMQRVCLGAGEVHLRGIVLRETVSVQFWEKETGRATTKGRRGGVLA